MGHDVSAYGAFRYRMGGVLNGYITAGIWSEGCQGTAEHDNCRGSDCDTSLMDIGYGSEHLSAAAARDAEADVEGFIKGCLAERPNCFDTIDDDAIGHDIWLTRNGHGAGFWDRGLGELGDWLTGMCKPMGSAYMYINASGEVEIAS